MHSVPRARSVATMLLGLFAAACAPSPSPSSSSSIVLVTLDTTRADHLGCYGNHAAATPTIDALARQGTVFDNAVAQVPATLPSHASIFTSLWPFVHGVRDNGIFHLDARATTMAAVLRAAGYRTGAVVASVALDARYGLDQGFDVYDATRQERRADEVTDRALAFLASTDARRFFLWVHYYDPHAPYDPPAPFRERFAQQPYDGELAFLDHELGRLVEYLRAREQLDRTVMVVTADHGEGLGEHGENTHGHLVYEPTLHVPLIIRGPGVRAQQRVAATVRLIDVMPTALAAANVSVPGDVMGVDLRGVTADLPAYFETYVPFFNFGWSPLVGVRIGNDKYIHAPRDELYDLAADASETHNVIAERAQRAAELRASLSRLGANREATLATAIDVSQAERDKLAQLGYAATAAKPAWGGPDPKDVIDLLAVRNHGAERLGAGNADAAIAAFRTVLERCPGDAQVRSWLGQALMQKKAWHEARSELERALHDRHSLFSAHHQLALCCLTLGDDAAALHHLEVAMTHDQQNVTLAREIALVHARRGDAANAQAWLDRCRQITTDREVLAEIAQAITHALTNAR